MEFLKNVLGDELYGQVSEKLKESKIKLADLSSGEYVGMGKFKAMEMERNESKASLEEANKAIEGFKAMDIDGIKKAADEWKTKFEKAEKDAAGKIDSLNFEYSLDKALLGHKVKDIDMFKVKLNRDKLKRKDNTIEGLNEQIEELKKSHSFIFDIESDSPPDPKPKPPILPTGTKFLQPKEKNTPPSPNDPFVDGFDEK